MADIQYQNAFLMQLQGKSKKQTKNNLSVTMLCRKLVFPWDPFKVSWNNVAVSQARNLNLTTNFRFKSAIFCVNAEACYHMLGFLTRNIYIAFILFLKYIFLKICLHLYYVLSWCIIILCFVLQITNDCVSIRIRVATLNL